MEELREFINNTKFSNNCKQNTKNTSSQLYSDGELIALLETDNINVKLPEDTNEPCEAITESRLEKNIENNMKVNNSVHVFRVEKNIIGLTNEIRECFYSKLKDALTENYILCTKQSSRLLADADICDIAKKIEYGTLCITEDLSCYKCSVAEIVVNLKKQSCVRELCRALSDRIELLRLCNKMQTIYRPEDPVIAEPNGCKESRLLDIISNPKQKSDGQSITPVSTTCKEAEPPLNQSSTETKVDNILNNHSNNSTDSRDRSTNESEYFTCGSSDSNILESQQNSRSNVTNITSEDCTCNLPEISNSTETDIFQIGELQPTSNHSLICNNDNTVNKIEILHTRVLRKRQNKSDENEINPVSTQEIPPTKKRKHNFKSNLSSITNCLPINQNKENLGIINNCDDRNNNVEKSGPHQNNCPTVILNNEQNRDMNANKTTNDTEKNSQYENLKVKKEPIFVTSTNELHRYCEQEILVTNSLSKQTDIERCDKLICIDNVDSSGNKNSLQSNIYKSKNCLKVNSNNICKNNEIVIIKKENIYSSKKDLSSNNRIFQTKLEFENDVELASGTSTCSDTSIENVATEENYVHDIITSNNYHEGDTVDELNYLLDERAFESERFILLKEYEELKKCTKERECIYQDHEKVFEIIIPIMKKYYLTDFIPDELCYGKILHRLQIDLANVKMCDNDIASYTKDSIESRRYLCDHCIVQ